jgi:hypothetical protein
MKKFSSSRGSKPPTVTSHLWFSTHFSSHIKTWNLFISDSYNHFEKIMIKVLIEIINKCWWDHSNLTFLRIEKNVFFCSWKKIITRFSFEHVQHSRAGYLRDIFHRLNFGFSSIFSFDSFGTAIEINFKTFKSVNID